MNTPQIAAERCPKCGMLEHKPDAFCNTKPTFSVRVDALGPPTDEAQYEGSHEWTHAELDAAIDAETATTVYFVDELPVYAPLPPLTAGIEIIDQREGVVMVAGGNRDDVARFVQTYWGDDHAARVEEGEV